MTKKGHYLLFIYYTDAYQWKYYYKYRKRGKNKPYVYIDTAINSNGMLDCYIFNAPMIDKISVVAVFKDPRQLEEYGCCEGAQTDNLSFLFAQIKDSLTKKKLYYYR